MIRFKWLYNDSRMQLFLFFKDVIAPEILQNFKYLWFDLNYV